MPFPRSPALRTLTGRSGSVCSASRSSFRSGRWQRSGARRGYASQGTEGGHKAVSSDMPWIIGSVAVSVPATYFLLNSGDLSNPFSHPLPGDKHHGEHDEEHEEGEEEGEGAGEEDAPQGEEEQGEEKPAASEKSEGDESKGDESTGDESKGDESKEESSKDQDGGEKDKSRRAPGSAKGTGKTVSEKPADGTLSGKRAVKGGADVDWDTEFEYESDSGSRVIHRPDAKGGAKRRIESPYGIKQGSGDNEDDNVNKKTAVAGDTSKQQYGLSNTDTKHSYDLMKDPEKSKKPEGVPDTAKLQGTVDPHRGKA